jgi:hypothetical protein
VFIDDIERCQPPRSIEVCEAVNHLLSHQDVVVVLIGDMQTIATAAEAKYKDLAPRYRSNVETPVDGDAPPSSFGELYLQKVVQFRFDVPVHDHATLQELATRMLQGLPLQPAAREEHRRAIRPLAWVQKKTRLRRLDRAADAMQALSATPTSGPPPDADVSAVIAGAVDDPKRVIDGRRLLGEIEADHLALAYKAIFRHVRPLPRDVKRILNRVRFMLYLTLKRQLMAPDGPLTPEAAGKWALLAERWPDLALAISDQPAAMAKIERESASTSHFSRMMTAMVPGYANSGELRNLIVDAPSLQQEAAVLARLAIPSTENNGALPTRQ